MKRITRLLMQSVAMLLMLVGNASLAMAQDAQALTVFDGDATNGFQPYYLDYGDAPQRHEMIFPATALAGMKDGDISKLQFYTPKKSITPGVTVRVVVQEVAQTELTSFIDEANSTTVYEGPFNVENYMVEIPFTTTYNYKGGNLMVGVYTLSMGNYSAVLFYGQNLDYQASIYGMAYGNANSYLDVQQPTNLALTKFLPKTTFTYTAGATEENVLDNILAMKNYQMQDPASSGEDAMLKLSNVKVTYVNAENDFVLVEDESAGYAFENTGMSSLVSEGQILNGKIAITVSDFYGIKTITLKNGLEGATIMDGQVQPIILTTENAQDYANDYDFRLVEIADAELKTVAGDYVDEIFVVVPQLSDAEYSILDRFNVVTGIVENGLTGTLTGYLMDYPFLDAPIFVPTAFKEPVVLENLKALKTYELDPYAEEAVELYLNADNLKITYANTSLVMLEDESAGWYFENTTLGDLVTTGQTLNGKLKLTIAPGWFGSVTISLPDGISGVTVTDGEPVPFVVTDENVQDFANDCDFRYAQFDDALFTVTNDDSFLVMDATLKNLGKYSVYDRFNLFTDVEEGEREGTFTGYICDFYGSTMFIPITFEENQEAPVVELADINAFKNFEFTDGSTSADAVLTLTDAKVTYVAEDGRDIVMMEDASSGYRFQNTGLNQFVKAGDTLNGPLAVTLKNDYFEVSMTLKNGVEGVTVTEGEVTPWVVNADNISEYVNNYEWRYAQFEDVTVNVAEGTNGTEITVSHALMGTTTINIMDMFGVVSEGETATVEDGAKGVMTGYLYTVYDYYFFTPVAFEETAVGINGTFGDNANAGNEAVYNLNGQRVSPSQKGIVIKNGKKVVVK